MRGLKGNFERCDFPQDVPDNAKSGLARMKIRVGILIGCSYTSPKLYARTLLENLPPDEFEVTLIALDKPSFAIPPHCHLIELNPEPMDGVKKGEAANNQVSRSAPASSFRSLGAIRRVWRVLAPRNLRAIAGHIREGRRLAGRIRGLPLDILHANQFGGNADALAGRLAGYRVVTTLHISTAADKFEKTPALASHIINLLTVLSSRRLIAVSRAIFRDWSRYTLGSPRRFDVVHHGLVYRDEAAPPERRAGPVIRFGTAAMLHPKKGQRYLIEAFSRLAAKYPDVELLIAGEGSDGGHLRALAGTLPHADRIKFLGFVADMDTFYGSIDVFVLPSLTEPFGYVLIEAMANALPVVASETEAIPEIVLNGQTGLLVPVADRAGLCTAMERMTLSEGLRKQMGQRGRKRVLELFTVDSLISGTTAAYRAALP